MSGAKGRTRQDRRLVDMDKTSEPEPDFVVPDGETYEETMTYPVSPGLDDTEAQIVVRTSRLVGSGQLVGFAIMLEVRQEGTDAAWDTVERVDCAHGYVHADQYTRKRKKRKNSEIVPSHCKKDLDAALRWATDYIWDIEERITAWR